MFRLRLPAIGVGAPSGETRPGNAAGPTSPSGQRRSWSPLWLLPMLLLIGLFAMQLRDDARARLDVSYTFFRHQLESGNVKSVVAEGERLRAKLAEPVTAPNAPPEETTRVVETAYSPFGDDTLLPELREQGVDVTVRADSTTTWWALLIGWGPILLVILLFASWRGEPNPPARACSRWAGAARASTSRTRSAVAALAETERSPATRSWRP